MTREMTDKLASSIDGALELLDRQLLDVEGRMLGKADDVELTQTERGLTVTALLTGQVALLHRLGGRLGNELVTKYVQLRPSETNRSRPWRIDIDDVERLDSAVHLRVKRDESVGRDIETFRLGTVTGMDVIEPDGRRVALVVGHGYPGSLLGYDRHENMGPWLVRRVVGWLHRHTCVVDIEHVQILWNNEEVRLDSTLAEVKHSAIHPRD
jgi:sporulation protein YlmC with PRC-barrel domain